MYQYQPRAFVTAARVEALFASNLQQSEQPTDAEVQAAIRGFVARHGHRAIAAMVAGQYGDHPIEAAARMCWCRSAVQQAYCCGSMAVAA